MNGKQKREEKKYTASRMSMLPDWMLVKVCAGATPKVPMGFQPRLLLAT